MCLSGTNLIWMNKLVYFSECVAATGITASVWGKLCSCYLNFIISIFLRMKYLYSWQQEMTIESSVYILWCSNVPLCPPFSNPKPSTPRVSPPSWAHCIRHNHTNNLLQWKACSFNSTPGSEPCEWVWTGRNQRRKKTNTFSLGLLSERVGDFNSTQGRTLKQSEVPEHRMDSLEWNQFLPSRCEQPLRKDAV